MAEKKSEQTDPEDQFFSKQDSAIVCVCVIVIWT